MPSYTIKPLDEIVNEGTELYTSVKTTGVDPGTILYWTFSGDGINDLDFSNTFFGKTQGWAVISDWGDIMITQTIAYDQSTEGEETFYQRWYLDSARTNQVGETVSVGIRDTSVSQPPTYSISTSAATINEGSSFTTTINTTNVNANTTLYWSLSGNNINSTDFSNGTLNGSGIVDSDGSFSFSHTLANDLATEGNETIQIKLFSDANRTQQVGTTKNIVYLTRLKMGLIIPLVLIGW